MGSSQDQVTILVKFLNLKLKSVSKTASNKKRTFQE